MSDPRSQVAPAGTHVQEARRHLLLKLAFLLHDQGIKATDVFNMDETSVRLLPQSSRGWAKKGRSEKAVFASTRSFVTVNLALRFSWSVPADHACFAETQVATSSPILSQIVYDGITFKSLPPGPRPQWHCASHGPNHVSTQDTLLEFMHLMQAMVDSSGERGRKWLCLLDCAPSHVSTEFLAASKKELPRMTLCFVAPRLTSITQPLDLAVIRPWKACIRREASKQWARSVLEGVDPAGLVRKAPQLKLNFQDLVISTCLLLSERTEIREKAWQHLQIPTTEASHRSLVKDAVELHEAGLLFATNLATDADQDEEDEGVASEEEKEETQKEQEHEQEPQQIEFEQVGPGIEETAVPSFTEVPDQQAVRRARFLALRLVYGSPSAKVLDDLARSAKVGAKAQLDLLASATKATSSSSASATKAAPSGSASSATKAASSGSASSGVPLGEPVGMSHLHPGKDPKQASTSTTSASASVQMGEPVGVSDLHPGKDPKQASAVVDVDDAASIGSIGSALSQFLATPTPEELATPTELVSD